MIVVLDSMTGISADAPLTRERLGNLHVIKWTNVVK